MSSKLRLKVGVKSDPVLYRYSYDWLFSVMEEAGVYELQLGSFFELYHLPDVYFQDLRRRAADHGVVISSVFTSHRELGGFYVEEPGYEQAARRNYERFIEVASFLGAKRAGSNPGSVLRDRMDGKNAGTARYIGHMKELMVFAHDHGIEALTMEPMSCLAEPPTLPDEIQETASELMVYHLAYPDSTASIGICADVAHGYTDETGCVRHGHMALLESALPYIRELHLKNTDAQYGATFGFTASERSRGIIEIPEIAAFLCRNQTQLPVNELVGYLEFSGLKLGRDYSDSMLGGLLKESLAYLLEAFCPDLPIETHETVEVCGPGLRQECVLIAPSVMCADPCNLERDVHSIETLGIDYLHIDVMDACFVPNMPVGLDTIKALKKITALPFDIHLMVEDNDRFIEWLAPLGLEMLSIHAESSTHLDRSLARVKEYGIRVGLALNPHTPLDVIRYVADRLDFVLLMTVNPGFAGQKLVPSAIRKIADCRQFLDALGIAIPIEVDGNVSFEHIPAMVAAGADILVAGSSSLFSAAGTLTENMRSTREAIHRGLAMREGYSRND